MAGRGSFCELTTEQYDAFVSAPHRVSFLDQWERLNREESERLAGEEFDGYTDKAWWGLFCILRPGILDSDPVSCWRQPDNVVYWFSGKWNFGRLMLVSVE